MTDTKVSIEFTWGTQDVPVTAWVGYQNGKAYTWFSTQAGADFALAHRKIDSAIPAEHIAQNRAANAARARKARIAAKVARVYTPPASAGVRNA